MGNGSDDLILVCEVVIEVEINLVDKVIVHEHPYFAASFTMFIVAITINYIWFCFYEISLLVLFLLLHIFGQINIVCVVMCVHRY